MQTFSPIQYLMIDVASNFGLDKENWDTRLDWFAENQKEIEELIQISNQEPRKIASHPLMKKADAPALFFAGIKAWDKANRGEAIGYPVSLDATASGAQLLSILIGCEKSARLCNVVDTGRREDLYTNVHGFMVDRLGPDETSRDDSKQAVNH